MEPDQGAGTTHPGVRRRILMDVDTHHPFRESRFHANCDFQNVFASDHESPRLFFWTGALLALLQPDGKLFESQSPSGQPLFKVREADVPPHPNQHS